MFQKIGPPDVYMLEFPVRPHRKSARLRHKFPNMEALTVCAHLQLDPTCHGLSTVFSYAIRSFIKEFQLQARITENEPVQLALLVHGSNTTYVTGFPNDASWHFVCASLVANSGKWGIWVDGMVVGSGNSLNTSNYIGGDGLFMIGQDQEPYGGYNGDKALCGNVTQLYMWDRLLVDTEIQSMEKVCSPVPSGLFFKWNKSALEIETSLQTRRRNSPCKGSKSQPPDQLISGLHPNFSVHTSNKACVTLDPASGKLINDSCWTQRGSVCLFPKEQLDFLGFPGTLFFSQVSNEFHSKPNTENTNVTLFTENELTRHIYLLSAILRIMDSNADIITHSDLLYLTETIEKAAQLNKIDVPTEVFISMIRSCLELVSRLIDPDMAKLWDDLRDRWVCCWIEIGYTLLFWNQIQKVDSNSYVRFISLFPVLSQNYLGPLTMVENIDKLLWTLADELWAERKSFTMSTKNMDIHLEPRGLAQMSCSCVFKPSLHGSQFGSHDEILIPESEMQRVFLLGRVFQRSHTCLRLLEYRVHWSAKEESILTKLTFIGSGASLCALVVTLMLFTVLDIPKSDRTSVHKNLFVSLTCAQIVLLCSGSAVHNKVACMLVAALMHLFFMASFSWMLVEGLLLWSKVVSVNLSEDRHMKYYYLIGWGLPVLIVTITLASASGKYSADGHCWLSVQNGVIWGFAGPVNIMILTRVVLITIATAKRRSLMMNNSPEEQVSEQIRAAVKAVLVLLPILGLTWLCGVLVPFSMVIAYIFSLLNSLQRLGSLELRTMTIKLCVLPNCIVNSTLLEKPTTPAAMK
ncbi:Adhesion G-protein coupled receptor D2 [Anabarilius grahami]|uniref:Adhesion G-protein coupled receptor D2 n=1 Tax=Anabarilius grahami TaxID=495550 RepID=A0A3N0Y3N7_ANAGA|nr:Adhesion G-protein coupled receptor D2 [Anabarilius grahami]